MNYFYAFAAGFIVNDIIGILVLVYLRNKHLKGKS